ncbi:hypothetical protein [Clostridium sp. L74]|uniref:hypothetical protein n=1 Tax=Clostridium sp. L74 TaxID=1560217 RepID=UPI0006ABC683|nr:hypothetical protein [Clostridium sp. L74]KOR24201.1 hypothetical protein ND00_29070 [Clostridium sp. L74]
MKKIFNKISLLFVLILSFALIALVGCAPKGNPEETLNTYYDSIKNNNIEKAYDTFCEQSKKDFKKEDFTKWRNAEKEIYKLKDIKAEKVKEFKGSLEDIEFKNIVEFNVTEKGEEINDDNENKEQKLEPKMYVVNDNGEWKIYFGKKRGNQLASLSLTELARRNLTKDVDKANILLEEATRLDPNNKDAEILLKRIPQIKAINLLK